MAAWLGAQAGPLAQQPAAVEPTPIGSSLSCDLLRDLPSGGNLFAILETTQAELVTDRFNSAGLNAGASSRAGAFLGSWSQTKYRIGDIDVASPSDGSPLLFPEMAFWREAQIMTAAMPPSIEAPGLGVTLEPARPAPRWSAIVEATASGGSLASSDQETDPPAIASLRRWGSGHVVIGGPIRPNLGITLAGSWARTAAIDRSEPIERRQQVGSAFGHLVRTTSIGNELRVLGWLQRAQTPEVRDLSLHLQSTFERRPTAGLVWKVYGGYTRRGRTREEPFATSVVVDRLIDGPIPTLTRDRESAEARWSLGGIVSPIAARRSFEARVEIDHASRRSTPFSGAIGELVDGVPARLWIYDSPGLESARGATNVAALIRDRTSVGEGITLDGWLRIDSVRGSARDAAIGITWTSLLPGVNLRWNLGTGLDLAFFTGYRRAASTLLLDLLAHGDPAAPAGEVRRWDASAVTPGTLIARVGPGTAGDPAFSAIDPDLARPHTDEFSIGLESRPRKTLRLAVAGIARRQSSVVNAVNVGVPIDSYATFTIPDANVDLIGSEDDHQLVVFNRLPESFGRDRYLLANPRQEAATSGSLVITAQASTDRLFMLIGATASAAVGPAGNLGFRAVEDDQDMVGELVANPNATPFARGRLFGDRAYTIKWTTVYRFPADVRLGVIARYQDGQPFSRLVLVDGLNQGREAVRAFANGRSRFAFTGTVDARLQKGFVMGTTRLEAIVDVYNVLDMKKEVEERVVTGDRFREITAVQPPRSFHVGVRVSFDR